MASFVGSGDVTDCVFCLLVAGETEVSIVHQDERTVTFMDIEPAVRRHRIVCRVVTLLPSRIWTLKTERRCSE